MKTSPREDRLQGFQGLDLRRLQEAADGKSCRVAKNVDLTLGTEYTVRDGLRRLMPLDAQSKGLYAIGGTLRAVAPGGQSIPLDAVGPVHVKYDHLSGSMSNLLSITASVIQNSADVSCLGALWPAWSVGGTLTIDGHAFTVIAMSSDRGVLTMSGPWLDSSLNSYPFTLVEGASSFVSVTASVPNGSNIVTFSAGVLPTDMSDSTISFPSTGFTSRVSYRLSDTSLQMIDVYNGGAMTSVAYTLSNVAGVYPVDTLVGVRTVESIGAQADFGAYPYLVVEKWADPMDHLKGTVFEHHWIRSAATAITVAPNTLMSLPFTPGPSVVKMAGKLWAIDDTNGVVRYCSTLNGPSDWELPNDAGYIPVITHASGDRRLQALGVYDEKLAVIFADSVQLWAVDPEPANITMVRNIVGPGTEAQRSVANVVGDLFYFTAGGFRSLHTQTLTNQIQEQDDIGAKIAALTSTETASSALALWSQSRGQYLCAFGTRVYALRYSPKSKVIGWTTWELPVAVEAMVELGNVLYVRSGNWLYRMEAGYDDGTSYDVVFNEFTARNASVHKRFDFLEVFQRGTSAVEMSYDMTTSDAKFTLAGSSVGQDRLYLGGLSRTAAVRFTGKGPWTLSAYLVQYTLADW